MAPKRGLNQTRGLDALIKQNETIITEEKKSEENVSRETLININLIEPNRLQPRKKFDEDELAELADSIKQHGLVQPIIVQKKGERYEIIAGERRWRASRLAKLKEVPVIIRDYEEKEVFEIALIENIQRKDLNDIEEAMAYKRLIEENNLKQDELAERVSKSRVAITNSMRLLKLDERVQQMIIDELISGGHARTLLAIEDGDLQYETATRILDEKLSVRETEKLVKSLVNPKTRKGRSAKVLEDEAIYKGYEDKLRTILGSKVEIQRKENNKGKIVIEFYSADEFEKIYEIIRERKTEK